MFRSYFGEMPIIRPNVFQQHISHQDQFLMFHRVMNMNIYHAPVKGSPLKVKHTIASQYDVAVLTGDDILFENSTHIDRIDVHRYFSTMKRHWEIGAHAVKRLIPMMNHIGGESMVSRTAFSVHLSNLTNHFELFTPFHCAMTNIS